MRAISESPSIVSTKIEGHDLHTRDKSVPLVFSAVAKMVWRKPAAHIAALIHKDIRTGKRVLAGQAEVPVKVMLALDQDMLKPERE